MPNDETEFAPRLSYIYYMYSEFRLLIKGIVESFPLVSIGAIGLPVPRLRETSAEASPNHYCLARRNLTQISRQLTKIMLPKCCPKIQSSHKAANVMGRSVRMVWKSAWELLKVHSCWHTFYASVAVGRCRACGERLRITIPKHKLMIARAQGHG